ncbi:hypothetical protein F1L26_02220 [Escherichia coli]|nr:hypothetical protein [Escherichia coli]
MRSFFSTLNCVLCIFSLALLAINDYLEVIGIWHMCRSGPGIPFSIQIQRVAGMCKPGKYDSQRRFTSVAIRCDTSEETRSQPKERWHAKNISQPLLYQKPGWSGRTR